MTEKIKFKYLDNVKKKYTSFICCKFCDSAVIFTGSARVTGATFFCEKHDKNKEFNTITQIGNKYYKNGRLIKKRTN